MIPSMRYKLAVFVALLVSSVFIVQLFVETRRWYVRRTSRNLDDNLHVAPLTTIPQRRNRVDQEPHQQPVQNTSNAEKSDAGSAEKMSDLVPVPHYARRREELVRDKYTIIIQTYKRKNILKEVLKHYCRAPRVDQILVVWNNVGEAVPSNLSGFACKHRLIFIPQKRNSIRNRFKPFPQIRTEGNLIGNNVSHHNNVTVVQYYSRLCRVYTMTQ